MVGSQDGSAGRVAADGAWCVCYLIPEKFKLSARGYHRVLRVARTLADLEGSAPVKRVHVAEALSYRRIAPGR